MRCLKILLLLVLAACESANTSPQDAFVAPEDRVTTLPYLVENMSRYTSVESRSIGIGGLESEVYKLYEQLSKQASDEELIKLLDHESDVVCFYASWALVDHNYEGLPEVLAKFKSNDRIAETVSGCTRMSMNLSQEIYVLYRNKVNDDPKDPKLAKMDSIMGMHLLMK